MQKLSIFYFSGTGNSENVAKWMALTASLQNGRSDVFSISDINRNSGIKVPEDSIVVFISPVHGFNYPPVMLSFISRFPKGRNKVILMDTRAGILIGNFNLPGISGAAFILSSIILLFKGYSIAGTKSVDLPSNWMSLHPALGQKSIRILHGKHKSGVMGFAEKILAGEKVFIPFYEFIVDLIFAPVSIAYYFIGRFFFAKTFYTSDDCNNCDICVKNCPVGAIIKVNDRPYWTFRCESCMRCMSNCPRRSIETAHGFIFSYCIISSVVTGILFFYFDNWFFLISNGLLRFAAKSALILLLLGLTYRIAHFLLRFKIFERLMVYTSLTKYKFWGKRYKALKNF